MIEQETAQAALRTESVPLCVDMDGTLLRTDTLFELALSFIRQRPASAWLVVVWALRGRPFLKSKLAEQIRLDPETLPYNDEVVSWLRLERRNGRRLLLVTGANRAVAEPVADFLCLFEAVISSGEDDNLTGARKGALLRERFGSGGFDYAGNAYPDLKVFRESRAAVLVNASDALIRETAKVCSVERIFRRGAIPWMAVLRALRVYQWVKNLLVFVPVIASHNILNGPMLFRSTLMWLAFSLCTSSVYVMNDLMDLESDRRHPTKKHRPFASGVLPVQWAFALAPLLFLASLGIAARLPLGTLLVLGAYCGLAMIYTTVLKRQVLIDVFALSLLYTCRIWAGHAATGIPLSPWLLSFAMFIFLSLAFSKRVSELTALDQSGRKQAAGRGYRVGDASQLTIFGVSSGFIASLVLSLYIDSSAVVRLYQRPIFLWALCPIVLYWICRMWMLAHRGELNEDPIWFTIRDPVTYWLGLAGAAALAWATKDWLAAFQTFR